MDVLKKDTKSGSAEAGTAEVAENGVVGYAVVISMGPITELRYCTQ